MSKKYESKQTKKDGGYYFDDYKIHVASTDLSEAKAFVKKHYGVDVDKDPNPDHTKPVEEKSAA